MPPAVRACIFLFLGAAPVLPAQQPGDQLWFFPTGAPVVSAPAINWRGNIVLGSEDHFVYSMTPELHVNWAKKTGDLVTGNTAASPYGYVVSVSWDGVVYAFYPDGSVAWTYDTLAFISASPAISSDGSVYVGCRDGLLYAFDPTGQVKWFYIAGAPIQGGVSVGLDGTLYFGDESGTLHALRPDGIRKWQFVAAAIPDRDSRIRTIPAVDWDGTVFFGSGNHYLYALRPDGTLKWEFLTSDKNDSSPALDSRGNIVFASRDGNLYKVLADSGELVWKKVVGDVFYCGPAVDEADNVYIAAYIGSGLTRLYCLDPSGNVLWDRNFPGLNDSSPLLTADGSLYIGFDNGNLYRYFTGRGPASSAWPMLARNGARSSTIDSLFGAAKPRSGWLFMDGLGLVYPAAWPWCYSLSQAWILPGREYPDSLWYFDGSLERWNWTSGSVYPLLYMSGIGWTYHLPDTRSPHRRFYRYATGEVLIEGDF